MFEIGRFVTRKYFIFNRLDITGMEYFSVHINIAEYLSKVYPIAIDRTRNKQYNDPCTTSAFRDYQDFCGSINFIGHAIISQASFVAIYLQEKLHRLTVANLALANCLLHNICCLNPTFK